MRYYANGNIGLVRVSCPYCGAVPKDRPRDKYFEGNTSRKKTWVMDHMIRCSKNEKLASTHMEIVRDELKKKQGVLV
jgi:predicted ATPase